MSPLPGASPMSWLFFAFISLFTVIGALVMARGLRRLTVPPRKPLEALFLLVWAIGFMGIPLGMGWRAAGAQFVLMQAVLITVVLVFALTLAPRITLNLRDSPTGTLLFGGLFVVVGLGVGGLLLRQGSGLGQALLFVAVFSGSGALVMAQALRKLVLAGDITPPEAPDDSSYSSAWGEPDGWGQS